MRRMVSAAALILFGCLSLAAASTQDEVLAAEKAWVAAMTKGDMATVDKMLADTMVYIHSSALVENKAEYFGKLKSGASRYDVIQEEGVTAQMYGDTGIVNGKVRMQGISAGSAFNVYTVMTHVWVKQAGAWKLAAIQNTRIQQ